MAEPRGIINYTTTDTATAVDTLVVTHGFNIQENDLLLAIVHWNVTTTVTSNGGAFNEVFQEENPSASNSQQAFFTRIATDSEASTYTWDTTTTGRVLIQLLQIRGVPVDRVWAVPPSAATRTSVDSGTYLDSPIIFTEEEETLSLGVFFSDNDAYSFSDFTNNFSSKIEDASGSNPAEPATVVSRFNTKSGDQGNVGATMSASGDIVAHHVALNLSDQPSIDQFTPAIIRNRPWTTQPPKGTQPDLNNPYGRHLVQVIVPGWGEANGTGTNTTGSSQAFRRSGNHVSYDLAIKGTPTTSAGMNSEVIPYRNGESVRVVTATQYSADNCVFFQGPTGELGPDVGGTGFSVLAIHKPEGSGWHSTNTDPRIWTKDEGFTLTDHDLTLGYLSGTFTVARFRIRLGASSRDIQFAAESTYDIPQDEWQIIAGTCEPDTSGSTRISCHTLSDTNGYQLASSIDYSGLYTPRTTTTEGIYNTVGLDAENRNPYQGSILCVYFFRGLVLTEKDFRSIFDNPWQVFKPQYLYIGKPEARRVVTF